MQVKIKYNIKETYTLHMCYVLSSAIKKLKALIIKNPSVSQARSSLGRSFHSFVAAYSNAYWPIAVLYLGRWSSLLSMRVLWRISDRNEKITLKFPGTVIVIDDFIY